MYLTPLYFRAGCRTFVYKWRYSPSSSPQDPIFTATSAPPPVTEGVNDPHIEMNTSLHFAGLPSIGDFDTLFEAGLVDMDRLDLDLSLLVMPSSFGEGSSLATALGMLSPFFPRWFCLLYGPPLFIFLYSVSTPDLQPPFFNCISSLAFFATSNGSSSTGISFGHPSRSSFGHHSFSDLPPKHIFIF